ncbi:uncharacterized protein BYT42DRAFT_570325 [Radiomyces spectabilis]|uniref:uncharacterized protein n=1 Tax=Radiomyces spectabilis TaxID=64574 RepID=UPI00221FA1AC|nr:uncharacterized protein BYT42DRAFT_570325 [Radiomyces spectabilis]KAI8377432.1 hypothetical protein BYT42DRAFT_570325 [Radiomyces spectabilis]
MLPLQLCSRSHYSHSFRGMDRMLLKCPDPATGHPWRSTGIFPDNTSLQEQKQGARLFDSPPHYFSLGKKETMEEQTDDVGLLRELEGTLHTLLADELLQDVPQAPTLEEIDTLIAVEQGHAYQIKIDRGPLEPIFIVVGQASTVSDIKKLIQVKLERLERQKKKSISWKYIWRSHCLMLEHQRLLNDCAAVSQLGIRQGSVLHFAKLAHQKGQHRRPRRWYKR